jgi:DNA-binding transcriptional ArsR family regulator
MSDQPDPSSAETAPRTSDSGPMQENRQLTDPRDMRALAHPTRIALLEVLGVYGPLTATQAGELIGESPSSCSFHLRTLARHHFVEETGEGRGRQRPWRLVTIGLSIPDINASTETFVAATALAQLFTERQLHRLRGWWARRATADQAWLDAAGHDEILTWLTPEELDGINDAVLAAMATHHERLRDPSRRPPGAELVELVYFSYPTEVGKPAEESGGVAGDE